MTTRDLEVQLQSPWHIGSGRGGGPGIDAHVRRTRAGLPTVPGRSLKGLLREAATQAKELGWHGADVDTWFGTALITKDTSDEADLVLEAARFRTEPGMIFVDSAVLGRTESERSAWEGLANGGVHSTLIQSLFQTQNQTAMEGGVPKENSLRSTEIVIPMTLWARVTGPPGMLNALECCLPLIYGLGKARRRGLGRVQLILHPVEVS